MKKETLVDAVSVLLVLLFVYAASSKLFDLDKFYFEINNQPFPNTLTPYIMGLIVIGELGLSVLLMVPATRKAGLTGSLVTMIFFSIYVVLVLLHAFPYVPCSCGGFISKLKWEQHLLFNLFFAVIAGIALKLHKSEKGYDVSNKTVKSL